MSKKCQIRVTASGKYCCEVHDLTVPAGQVGSIKYANLPSIPIFLEVTKDNWIPADPPFIEGSGTLDLLVPGDYRFEYDCSGIDCTEAPEEGAIGLCYDACPVEYDEQVLKCFRELKATLASDGEETQAVLDAMLACLAELKLLTIANNDAAALAELIAQMQAVCDKLLAAADADAEAAAAQLSCLEDIKDLLTCPPAEPLGVLTTW